MGEAKGPGRGSEDWWRSVIPVHRRSITALVTVALTAAWAVPLGVRPARAHAILVESDPAHRAQVPAGERTLVVRFNARIDRARSRLTLIGPDQTPTVLALLPGPDDVLSATAVLAPGAHMLRWQVLAVDGHITRGDVPFTVATP
jgi:copper resistance protein C